MGTRVVSLQRYAAVKKTAWPTTVANNRVAVRNENVYAVHVAVHSFGLNTCITPTFREHLQGMLRPNWSTRGEL